jgi:hypothetical protein
MRSVAVGLALAAVATAQCIKDFGNATFDLSKLRNPAGA